jgi:hypothetical protein
MTKGQVIFILLLLSLIVIAFITLEQSFDRAKGEETAIGSSSGFPEYDLIPEELKQKMDALKAAHYNINYTYCYFFDIEDVNKHYYITDSDMKIVHVLPVTDPQALALVEEKMLDNPGKDIVVAYHPYMMIRATASKEEREKMHKKYREHKDDPSWVQIQYILLEDTVDFSKLRVTIVQQTLPPYTNPNFLRVTHAYDEVDTLPEPIRGYDYFEKVMVKALMEHEVFTFYDLKGNVTVEFTVGHSPSPDLVEGFSTREDNYEAYKADGAFIKALNNLKVRWKPGKQGNSPVAVRIPLTFHVDGQTIRMIKKPIAKADLYSAIK